MPKSSFDQLVEEEQEAKQAQTAVDWESERERWLHDLSKLYGQIQQFLEAYIEKGQVQIRLDDVWLDEENIGRYKAPRMTIVIGRKTVTVQPIGTLLIGSKGRVDIIGPAGQARLLLLNNKVSHLSQLIHVTVRLESSPAVPAPASSQAEVNWVWRIVSRPPSADVIELTRESFLNLLAEVSNG
jgi:hypothetical protein